MARTIFHITARRGTYHQPFACWSRKLYFSPVLLINQITDIGTEMVSEHQDLLMFDLKLNKYE